LRSVTLIASLLLVSCGGTATAPVTPAPISTPAAIDQKIATGLADAASIIQGLEPLVATYPGLKDPLNQAIAIYEAAKSAGLVYHTAVMSGGNPDPTQVQAQVQQAFSALAGLQVLYHKP
jgi:hypothetical protein